LANTISPQKTVFSWKMAWGSSCFGTNNRLKIASTF
jgi:hypothetical protein